MVIQVGSPRQSQFMEESFVVVFTIRDVRILYKETVVGICHQLFQRGQLTGRWFKIVVVWLLWLVGTRFGIHIQFSVFDSLLVEDFVVKNVRPVVFESHKGLSSVQSEGPTRNPMAQSPNHVPPLHKVIV